MSKNTGTSELINYFDLGANGDVGIAGSLDVNTIANATTDTDKFLVSDTGIIKYRTGAELLTDIGAAPAVAGGYVPYTGANSNLDLGIYNLTANAVNVNGSGSNAGVINLESNAFFSLVNGYGTIGSGTTNQFNFYQTTGAGVFRGAIFSLNSITASATRTFTLPDADGTIALTSSLSGYLPLTGGTLTGALNGTSATFSGLITGQTTSAATITQNFLAYNSGSSISGASYDFQSGGTSQTARISANYEASSPDRMAMRFLVGQGSGLVEILKLFNSTMTVTGAATFSSSVTATGLIINNNGEALRAYGLSPNISFYNSANTVRGGYVNHDGSNMNIVANVGGISFTGAATFTSSVTAAGTNYLTNTSTGSGATYQRILNTGGDVIFGINNSTGGSLLPGAAGYATVLYNNTNTDISFGTNQLERMRITSGGDVVKKGTIADLTLGLSGAEIFFSRNNANYIVANGGTSCDIRIISNTNGVVLSAGGTSWGSLSDENSKDIIEPIENACYKLSQVRTVIGKYKTDDEDKRRLFLIAQDIEKVYPEAVFKIKNENKEESLGLNYQDLIPVLVKAIQEQQIQINKLKNL
jgi:hypothetical protein